MQTAFHKEQFQTLLMGWREYLISEIQDSLDKTYKFYQTDLQVYFDSELKKLLTRIDLIFNTYIREQIFKVVYFKKGEYLQLVQLYQDLQLPFDPAQL